MKLFRNLKKEAALLVLLGVVIAFFYKSIFFGLIPFPGDLLIANQEPYRSYSYLGFEAGAVPHKAQGPDVIKQLLPWKQFAVESLKKGEIPFWTPYNFSGNPLLANFQSGVFYPGNIVFVFSDFAASWSFFIILTPILSGLFTYLFLRRLKLGQAPSVLGAISYSFSLYMAVWIEYGNIGHTLSFLPLVLIFTDKIIEKVDTKAFLGLVLALFFAMLAGYIQGAFYIYAVAFIYFFYKSYLYKSFSLKKISTFLAGITIPVGLSAFQILPTLELFSNSTRGNYSLSQIQDLLNPIWYMITLIAPDFFGNPASRNFWFDGTYIERVSYFGLVPLVLALFALIVLRVKREVKIFALIFIVSLILTVDLIITKYFYLLPIPVISTAVPTRMLSILAFSGSVLAAFGFELLLEKKKIKQLFSVIIAALGILLTGFLFASVYSGEQILAENLNTSRKNLVMPFVTLLVFSTASLFYYSKFKFLTKYKKVGLTVLVISLTSFELFFYFQKITPFAPRQFLYPENSVVGFLQEKEGERFWGYGSAVIESNIGMYSKIYSPEGNDPLHIKEYTEFIESSSNGRIPDTLPRPDANVARGFGKQDITLNPYREKVLNILGVRYILNKDETINGDWNPDTVTFPEDKYKLVWQDGIWQAYENLDMTPRIFATDKYRVVADKSRVLRSLFDEEFNEQEEIVLLKDPFIASGENLNSEIIVNKYSPNEIVLDVSINSDALVFISDTFYPGWNAYVNGAKTDIYKANYAFRAVPVNSGKNMLVMKYEPNSFYYGIYISLGFTILLLIAIIYIKKYEN